MQALIVCLSVVGYLAAGLFPGRVVWAKFRPNTEPVNCKHWVGCDRGRHDRACYRWSDNSYMDGGEAGALALAAIVLWPVLVPLFALTWLVTRKPRPRMAELEARNKRLERELGIK